MKEINPDTVLKVFEDISRGEGGWRDYTFRKRKVDISRCYGESHIINKTMIYKLNNNLPSFGINRGEFSSPFKAVVRASSIYLNRPLYSLMQYHQGGHYLFEDEYVRIYEPKEPTKLSYVFVDIKPVYFAENEMVILYLDTKLDDDYNSSNTSISFKLTYKKTGNSYVGCLITPQHYIEVLKMVKEEDMEDELYIHSNFYEKIVKEINSTTVYKFLERITKCVGSWENNGFLRIFN